MLSPIEIRADFEADAFEITYRHLGTGALIAQDQQVAPCVSAGLDSGGNVIAIELLSLHPSVLAEARAYANAKGLAFPRDLGGLQAIA